MVIAIAREYRAPGAGRQTPLAQVQRATRSSPGARRDEVSKRRAGGTGDREALTERWERLARHPGTLMSRERALTGRDGSLPSYRGTLADHWEALTEP